MPVIEVSNLKKYYQVHQKEPGLWGSIKSLVKRKYYDVKAVDDVSFEINEGELVVFIGELAPDLFSNRARLRRL